MTRAPEIASFEVGPPELPLCVLHHMHGAVNPRVEVEIFSLNCHLF